MRCLVQCLKKIDGKQSLMRKRPEDIVEKSMEGLGGTAD